jgi:uncharacterized protein with beta-barrel porin domain
MVQGTIAPGFEAVKEELQQIFDDGFDSRAQLAVYHGEDLVIDLWADSVGGWGPDSLGNIFSAGKSIGAILMGTMVGQGHADW